MIYKYKFCLFFILLYLIFALPLILYSQYQNIKFEHLTIEDGLSNNKIRCTLQDRYGFIWIGTHDGLNKYDGYKFTIYRNNPLDSLSLSSNFITALYEDRSGDLWISTMGGGLNKFNRENEQFTIFSPKNKKSYGLNATSIKQIAEYHYKDEKVLWIGTFTGLHKMDIETQKFTHYPHTNLGDLYSHIQTVAVDKSGIVWIGSLKDGLHKFNPETEQYTHYQNDPHNQNSISDNHIFALFFDRNGILWIATAYGGLNKFDTEKKILHPISTIQMIREVLAATMLNQFMKITPGYYGLVLVIGELTYLTGTHRNSVVSCMIPVILLLLIIIPYGIFMKTKQVCSGLEPGVE